MSTPSTFRNGVFHSAFLAGFLLCVLAGCRGTQQLRPDPPAGTADSDPQDGWSCIRHPDMDRSIWFCTSPDENSWQRLGELSGLDPLEYQWWAQDVDGEPVYEAAPILGKRYTLPNRVYIVMGGAAIYNPFSHVPYLDSATRWLLDFPESAWAPLTRAIGRAIVFRPAAPLAEGYNVTTINNANAKDLMAVIQSPDTWGLVFFGHGNEQVISSTETIHSRAVGAFDMRVRQHHQFGKCVLNSCVSARLAQRVTSRAGTPMGHVGFHQPPFGTLYW